MVLVTHNLHARGRQRAARNSLRGDVPSADRQLTQLGFQAAKFATCIHQGSEDHVAANAGEAIEVSNLHLKPNPEI